MRRRLRRCQTLRRVRLPRHRPRASADIIISAEPGKGVAATLGCKGISMTWVPTLALPLPMGKCAQEFDVDDEAHLLLNRHPSPF